MTLEWLLKQVKKLNKIRIDAIWRIAFHSLISSQNAIV